MRSTLELSMIVKNGAAGLPRCIESVRPLVTRIVVGDTGSTDASAAIAGSLGAVVIDVPWTGDYAAARNRVLAQAECDWVLVLDPDEELDSSALHLILALIEGGSADAFQSWIWNYVDSLDYRAGGEPARVNNGALPRAASYPGYFRSLNTRLFRRAPDVYFEHMVHETILDRLIVLGRTRAHAPFVIHHFGYVEDAAHERKRKTELYGELSARKAAAEPDNGWAQLEMGMYAFDCRKDYRAAQGFLAEACLLLPASASAWLYAGMCCLRLGAPAQALGRLRQALRLDPTNSLAHASLGDLHFAEARYREARACFAEARRLGDASPLCLAKLGSTEVRLGLFAGGVEKIQEAAKAAPLSAEILDMLAIAALASGSAQVARSALNRRLALGEPSAFGSLVAASVFLHLGSNAEAETVLAQARIRFPHDLELLRLYEEASSRAALAAK